MLEKGHVDFIIDNSLQKETYYQYIPITKEQILIAVPKTLSVNERLIKYSISYDVIKNKEKWFENQPKVSVSEFKDEKFILLKNGNKMRQISNKIFKENSIIPDISHEFDHLMTSISYTEAKFGICFVTDTILKYAKKLTDITLYLPKTDHTDRTLYIIRKKNKYNSFASKSLIEYIIGFMK